MDNVVVLDIKVPRILVKHESRKLQKSFPEHLCSLLDSHARDIGLPGGVRSCIIGGNVSILFAYHVDLVHGQSDGLSSHHGENGIGSLADLGSPHLQLKGPILV